MTSLNSSISRRSFVATAGLAASGLLAGCDSAPSAKPKSADKAKITFCLDYTPNTNHTGVYVAKHEGYFAEEGLDVEIVQPAEDSAEALIGSGQAQLGVSYQDFVANVLSNSPELPIVAVAALIQHNTSGIMSRKEDGITSARGMEDHVYATWEMPVEQATIKDVMEADGGDYSKVKMVPYAVDDEVSGLKAKMFDTVWVYEGWAVQNAAVQGYEVNYFSFKDMDEVFDFYTPVIAVNPEFAEKSPEVVKAFLRAVQKGYQLAIDDPEAAASILCEEVPELDAALVSQSQAYLSKQYVADASSWGVIDKVRWARYFAWLNERGLVENKIDVNAGWTNEYLGA